MKRVKVCGVYAIRHVPSGRSYIGSSKDIQKRWWQHRASLKNGDHHADALQCLWAKDGGESLSFVVLEECLFEQLATREQCLLDAEVNPLNSASNVRCSAQDPRVAAKISAAKLSSPRPQYYDDENHRALLSLKGKERWARLTPSERKELTDTIHAEHASAEFRSAMSATKKAEWARLSVDERNSKMVVFRSKKRPDHKREITPKFIGAMKASWTDPVRRAKRIAAMKIGSARRWGKNGVGRCRATT